jgi:biopolymer transport protein ExbD
MSGDEATKGYAPRVIQTPGYHILPQYDLVHTRHRIEARKNKGQSFHLNLAPMVDMFSILVIYLIMNFSTDGEIFYIGRDVQLPLATAGRPMQSNPLVSVVNDNVMFDNVNGESIVEPNDEAVPRLRETLRRIKAIEAQIGELGAEKSQINIQADRLAPVESVKKVMRVLIEEGWTGINFVVTPEG